MISSLHRSLILHNGEIDFSWLCTLSSIHSFSRSYATNPLHQLTYVTRYFTIPMLIVHVFMASSDVLAQKAYNNVTVHDILELMIAIPVQFCVGYRFYVAAWRSVKHCSLGMDFLVALSTTIAFSYSLVAVLMQCSNPMFHSRHFFETSVFLITFVVLGKYMEAVAKGKTSRAIQQLMEMVPSQALLMSVNKNISSLQEGEKTSEYVFFLFF